MTPIAAASVLATELGDWIQPSHTIYCSLKTSMFCLTMTEFQINLEADNEYRITQF